MDYSNLGALPRKPDPRDIALGSVQAPIFIPVSYVPDISWLVRNFQGQTPTCGAHAASHFQAILEHQTTPATNQRYTPRFSWINIKTFDGYPLADGTDMRSIFKSLQNVGADDFEPLENDVTLPLETYSSPSAITPAMTTDAAQCEISSYAFPDTDFDSLCQAIYQNKTVLLLIKCDDGFWGTKTPTFTTPTYGHFIAAFGYDEGGMWIIDSADPNDALAIKYIAKQYIVPEFILEAGTAVDVPPSVQAVAVHPTLTVQEKTTIIQTILADLKAVATDIQQELSQKVETQPT